MFPETTPCCSNKFPECDHMVLCSANERMIRRIIAGDHTEPLTEEQREWLIDEAEHAGEGSCPREEAFGLSDVELSKRTINAWADYVRSNCL